MAWCAKSLSGWAFCLKLGLINPEPGRASRWSSYVDTLPTALDLGHVPALWHLQEVCGRGPVDNLQQPTLIQLLLQPSPSASQALEATWQKWMAEYEQQVPELLKMVMDDPSPAVPSLLEYAWARAIVSSRAIHLWSGEAPL